MISKTEKTKKIIISIIILLIILYLIFLLLYESNHEKGTAPELNVPDDVLYLNVEDMKNKKNLLKGVSATDNEDGDISDRIFISNISEFDEAKNRIVTYAVFDFDDRLTTGKRKIHYRNYTSPEIDIKKPLLYTSINKNEEFKQFISATSCTDGNISSDVNVEIMSQNGKDYVIYTVTDSTGSSSSLKLKADQLSLATTIDIKLKTYLLKVKKGTEIDPSSFIESVTFMGMNYNSLLDRIEIETDYDKFKQGIYEFIYRIDLNATDYGVTKLVVLAN